MDYRKHYNTKETPQSEALEGQVKNSAGGHSFEVDDWTRLDRFLVLGTEGGSYYANEHKLTRENAKCVERCLKADGLRVVAQIVELSDSGRAYKNDPALFALAMATASKEMKVRQAALAALPKVARIGTHLFHFAQFVEGFRGWGRALRRAVAEWYTEKDTDKLAYQLIKYQQRDDWSHRDLLRLSHPQDAEKSDLFKYVTQGASDELQLPDIVRAFEALKEMPSAKLAIELIGKVNLPREAIPTELLTDKGVQWALLQKMPMTAMIRNLGNLSKIELVTPGSEAAKLVANRLRDEEALRKARIHPIQVLAALTTYKSGQGARGRGQWTPVTRVVNALDDAFYLSFGNVEPTGKRIMLSLDVSGSMSCSGHLGICGVPDLTPRVGSAAMAMVTERVEDEVIVNAFTSGTHRTQWGAGYGAGIGDLNISSRQRLDDVVAAVSNLPFGGTDCALPMLHATKKGLDVDAFVIYTDSETWAGTIHPVQALQRYRDKTGIPAKLVVVGMVSNGFSIADPDDAGMLDVVGFDTAAPNVISDFIRS
jgi:60 kDa SS-A/Ro ribonucleoprotein